jgi:hypothetical protein
MSIINIKCNSSKVVNTKCYNEVDRPNFIHINNKYIKIEERESCKSVYLIYNQKIGKYEFITKICQELNCF